MKVVDLFAGCGGMSLGLEMAGLRPMVALERSPMAAETHFRNFHLRGQPWDEDAWQGDVLGQPFRKQAELGGTVVGDILEVVDDPETMAYFREVVAPDIVVGGPPCQGFSMAGRRNPKDDRNRLPWAFLEFVAETVPAAVVIENVVGITRAFRKAGADAPFDQLRQALGQTNPGYVVQPVEVNAKDFGVPQNRPRMMLLALREDLARPWGGTAGMELPLWRSADAAAMLADGKEPITAPSPLVPTVTHAPHQYLTANQALLDLDDDGYRWAGNSDRYSDPVAEFANRMRHDPLSVTPEQPANHTHRKHSPRVAERFALYHFFRDEGIPNAVLGLPYDRTETQARRMITEALDGIGRPDTVGQDHEDLADVILRLRTKKHTQRAIRGDAPAPTVVTLPDDYVHPEKPRIMTVRELARFQSFPDWFEFRNKETTGSHRRRVEVPQFSQVGNAVPPLLAAAVGRQLLSVLESS